MINTDKFDLVFSNYSLMNQLETESVLILNNFIDKILITGEDLLKTMTPSAINELKLISNKSGEIDSIWNNSYISENKNHRFFVSETAITEIYFNDSLDVWEEIKLVDKNKTQYVIELTFKSKRKNLRDEKIKKNKFRFVYSKFTNKTTCKRLTE